MDFDKIEIKENNPNFRRSFEEQFYYDIHKNINIELRNDLYNKLFYKYDPYIVLQNRFPYPLKNAKHFLIWFNPRYNWIEDISLVNIILKKYFHDKEIKYWENADFLRTIKHIRHLHVIVKEEFDYNYIS